MFKTEDELKNLANHLSCPSGEEGIKIAEVMNESNKEMTLTTIDKMNLQAGDRVLEIGPGNGRLATSIIQKIGNEGAYLGVDLSSDMVKQAQEFFNSIGTENTEVLCGNIQEINLSEKVDAILAVNVLYFIEDLSAFFGHLKSLVKDGGEITFGVRSKETLEELPVTKYKFNNYSVEEIEDALKASGFSEIESTRFVEQTKVQRQLDVDFEFVNYIIQVKNKVP